jgi:isochorismate hydrolase
MVFVIVAFNQTEETDFVLVKWIADGFKISDLDDILKQQTTLFCEIMLVTSEKYI